VSAEEIIRDRKILKRESFLNLSWNSYLLSKLIILFALSAIQTFSFVLLGNLILEVEWSMLLPFWFVLFTTSCMANVLGLNISSAFNSAVTVYVLIPLLLIPQMILSGLLFSFDKLNNLISTKGKVPVVADMMASRWAYEAMAVYQFNYNSYEEPYFGLNKIEAQSDFRSSFLVDELDKRRKTIAENITEKNDSIREALQQKLTVIQTTIQNDFYKKGLEGVDLATPWTLEKFTPAFDKKLEAYFNGYRKFFQGIYNKAVADREKLIVFKESKKDSDYDLNFYKNHYHNESLADLVTNVSEKNRIIEHDGKLVQQINPIFLEPQPGNLLDYRAHFFAPHKNLLGAMIGTYWFNVLVIWIMTLVLYITLYFELLKKFVNSFGNMPGKVSLPKVGLPKKK
jgi:hypothetical protein